MVTNRLLNDTTVLHGETVYRFADFKLGTGMLHNSKPQGFWTYFHLNGAIRAQGIYVNGKKHGEWNYYHPNGKKQAHGVYHKGQPIDQWQSFNIQEKLFAEVQFLPGQALKRFAIFYSSGDTAFTRSFNISEGTIFGTQRSYYNRGPLGESFDFKVDTSAIQSKFQIALGRSFLISYFLADSPNGQLIPAPTLQYHGNYKRFHSSGHIWEHCVYDNGLLVNVFETKNQWGTTLNNGKFRDGNGSVIRYHQNADTASIFHYKNGMTNGSFLIKESGDRNLAKGFFNQNNPSGEWTFYNINQRPSAVWQCNGDTIYASWLGNNGVVSTKGMFHNYLQEGEWITFDYLGDTLTIANYERGLLTGSYRRFNLGQLQTQGNYDRGLRVGKWQSFSNSGKISFEEDYGNDPVVISPPIIGEPISIKYPIEDGLKPWPLYQEGSLLGLSPEEITIYIQNEPYAVWFEGNSREGEVVIRCTVDEAGMITDFHTVKYANEQYKEEAEKLIRGMGAITPARFLGIPFNSFYFVSYYFEKI